MPTPSLLRLACVPALAAFVVGCVFDEGQPDLLANIEANPRPHFELFENAATGEYAFRFASEDHDTLLDSKWYQSRQGALGGVASVLDNGGLAQRYRVISVDSGGYGIELVAGNGWVIAQSYLYASPEAAEQAIATIIEAMSHYLEFQHQRSGARFEIYADSIGRYQFDLYADDGRLVLSSQRYSSEPAALNGAFSVRENSSRAERYSIHEAAAGGYYLELRARNGRTLATSPVFDDRSEAEASRDAIQVFLPELPIL